MEHGEGSDYSHLKSSKTLEEVLVTAMSFERSAHEFYTNLKNRVSKPIRDLVHELAEEEARHFKLLERLHSRPDLQDQIANRIRAPDSDHRFSDYVHPPDLGENPDGQAILQYAMGREHAAMEQYSALADEVPEGPIRDLFRHLAAQELSHKAQLEKRYYELVYANNA